MHFLILRTKHKLPEKTSYQTPPKPAKTSPITPLKKGKKKKKKISFLKISPLMSLPLHRKTLKFPAKNSHEKSIEEPQKNPLKKPEKNPRRISKNISVNSSNNPKNQTQNLNKIFPKFRYKSSNNKTASTA